MKDRKKPNMRRYHRDIFFPENAVVGRMVLNFFSQFEEVNLTYHSARELTDDKRGIIPLPSKADLLNPFNQLIEFYEVMNSLNQGTGVMQKCLIRVCGLSEEFDYCYVVAREGFIVSAWANDKTDTHRLTSAAASTYYNPETKEYLEIPMPEAFKEPKHGQTSTAD